MATTEYCTVAELRGRIQIGSSDATEDDRLAPAVVAASRVIDGWCGRRFWQDDLPVTARAFAVCDRWVLDLAGNDISTTTGLLVSTDTTDDGTYDTSLTIGTHFQVEPVNSYAPSGEQWPITRLRIITAGSEWFPLGYGRPTVSITARWGWPTVPVPVKEACLALAKDIWKSKDMTYGSGGDSFLGRFSAQRNTLAEALLAPYRHGRALAGMA